MQQTPRGHGEELKSGKWMEPVHSRQRDETVWAIFTFYSTLASTLCWTCGNNVTSRDWPGDSLLLCTFDDSLSTVYLAHQPLSTESSIQAVRLHVESEEVKELDPWSHLGRNSTEQVLAEWRRRRTSDPR